MNHCELDSAHSLLNQLYCTTFASSNFYAFGVGSIHKRLSSQRPRQKLYLQLVLPEKLEGHMRTSNANSQLMSDYNLSSD